MKLDPATVGRIRELLEQYRRELNESNYSMDTKAQRATHARNFVDWLAGEWDPGEYDGSLTPR